MDLKDLRIRELERDNRVLKEMVLWYVSENLRLQGIEKQDGPGTIERDGNETGILHTG